MVLEMKRLPEHLRLFVAREVEAGKYATEEQVIVAALEEKASTDARTQTIDEALAEARAQADRGETFEMTPDFWEQARNRAIENSRRGHRVRDDIKY